LTIQRSTAHSVDEKLAAAWLTRGVRPEVRAKLAAMGEVRKVPTGETLMRQGEQPQVVAVVIEGRVALRLRVPERGAITILTVEPGDVLGWSAVVPPYRATSTIVALTDSELLTFDAGALRHALESDDALAAQFYPVLLNAVARRLEGTRLQLLDLFSERWVDPW
jgi:CRP/FNR family cyclic AMP-dependent transcriptional regulator